MQAVAVVAEEARRVVLSGVLQVSREAARVQATACRCGMVKRVQSGLLRGKVIGRVHEARVVAIRKRLQAADAARPLPIAHVRLLIGLQLVKLTALLGNVRFRCAALCVRGLPTGISRTYCADRCGSNCYPSHSIAPCLVSAGSCSGSMISASNASRSCVSLAFKWQVKNTQSVCV